jgi:hypothetical protein
MTCLGEFFHLQNISYKLLLFTHYKHNKFGCMQTQSLIYLCEFANFKISHRAVIVTSFNQGKQHQRLRHKKKNWSYFIIG